MGRAVEVMFQHVENLKRMYTKEHTELVELRQTLMQNERSFGSQTDKGTPGNTGTPALNPYWDGPCSGQTRPCMVRSRRTDQGLVPVSTV